MTDDLEISCKHLSNLLKFEKEKNKILSENIAIAIKGLEQAKRDLRIMDNYYAPRIIYRINDVLKRIRTNK